MKFKPLSSSETGETAVRMMLRHPYFMGVYYSMALFELPEEWPPPFNTLATNGVSLWVNKKFWAQLNRDQKMTAIAHECGHKMYLHSTRIGARDKAGWNIAGDHRINLDLIASGFVPLEGLTIDGKPWSWCCDAKYNTPSPWTTEAIYDDIMEQAQKEAEKQGKNGQPGGQGMRDVLDEIIGAARDLCEFGEDGKGDKDEEGSKESPADFEGRVRRELKEMHELAKMAGNAPPWMQKMIDDADHVQVNWWEIVENICRMLHTNDYSWKRFNKRELVKTGAIAPDMYSPAVGGVVIYFDATGSCWNVAGVFHMHMKDIMEQLKPSWVEVRYFQTSVDKVERYSHGDLEISRTLHGGGGTDFRWLADDLEGMSEQPEVVFFLTDMYGPFGRAPVVEAPIYFLSISEVKESPFGEVISIS